MFILNFEDAFCKTGSTAASAHWLRFSRAVGAGQTSAVREADDPISSRSRPSRHRREPCCMLHVSDSSIRPAAGVTTIPPLARLREPQIVLCIWAVVHPIAEPILKQRAHMVAERIQMILGNRRTRAIAGTKREPVARTFEPDQNVPIPIAPEICRCGLTVSMDTDTRRATSRQTSSCIETVNCNECELREIFLCGHRMSLGFVGGMARPARLAPLREHLMKPAPWRATPE